MKVQIRKGIRAVVPFLVVLLIAGCSASQGGGTGSADSATAGDKANASAAGNEAAAPVFAVTTTEAVRGVIENYIDLNGDVSAAVSVDVYADTAGEVVKLNVSVGDYVSEGEVVAEVDPSRPGQQFVPSPVKSSINGTVTEVPVQVGTRIGQGVPVARISKINQLEITTEVPERFIDSMKVGLPAVLRFEAYSNATFPARVTQLSPVLNPTTRTMEVKLELARRDPRVKAGMYAEVQIITERKENVVKIPASCLVRRFGETFAYVVTDQNTAERRVVTPGIIIDDQVEVVVGVKAGDRVVIQGQNLLDDGVQVKVVDQVEPLSPESNVRVE